jgi:hypothetical protein
MGLEMKKPFALLLVMCLISAQINALEFQPVYQGTVEAPAGLERLLNTILIFFSSGYTRAIASIALGVIGIGMIMNRGEPGIVRKFIPWAAGCIILLSLSTITEMMGFTKAVR